MISTIKQRIRATGQTIKRRCRLGFYLVVVCHIFYLLGHIFEDPKTSFYKNGVVTAATVTGPCIDYRRPYEYEANGQTIRLSQENDMLYKKCYLQTGDHILITYLRSDPHNHQIGAYTERDFYQQFVLGFFVWLVVLMLAVILTCDLWRDKHVDSSTSAD